MSGPEALAVELARFIAGQRGLAERLLAVHVDDGQGHCRICKVGAQRGHHTWPCIIASQAQKVRAAESRR